MAGGAASINVAAAKRRKPCAGFLISAGDAKALNSFVHTNLDDDDNSMGAPDASVYESHSGGGIVDTLTGLLDKAQQQLNTATGQETDSKNN